MEMRETTRHEASHRGGDGPVSGFNGILIDAARAARRILRKASLSPHYARREALRVGIGFVQPKIGIR